MGRKKVSTLFSLFCLLLTGIVLIANISFDDVFTHVIKTNFCFPRAINNPEDYGPNNASKPGCVLPHVDPFDPAILVYLTNKTLECPSSPQLTAITSPDDWLIVQSPETHAKSPFDCYYSWVHRAGSDGTVSYGPVNPIPTPKGVQFAAKVNAVNTSCVDRESRQIIYRNIHFRVPDFDVSSSPIDTKPSVLILVIESLGRLSFQRFMSSTSKVLNEMGHFHHLTALNRVEENSFPNSMALLSGMAVTDDAASSIPGVRWDHGLPFVWDIYKNSGYVTAFLEDQPMAGLFSYYNRGFRLPPTDYYPVEFWSHMYPDGTANMLDLLVNPVNYCYEKVGPKVNIYLEMCSKFVERVHNRQRNPYFLYAFYSQMTHEDFNNFQLVDEPVAQFLSSLSTQVLNNSIIILMGDHGTRVGQISPTAGDPTNSPMGRLEGSLPFAAIRIPDSLDMKYPHLRKYLSLNENRLSTWFDVHQILLDIAQGNFDPIGRRKEIPVAHSLFREEVPISRTCDDANISPVYCACNGRVGINPRLKSHYVDAAKGLVDDLRIIFQKNKCRTRISYGKTIAGEYFYPRSNETWSTFERVKLTIEVRPSHAVISGTVYRWRNSTEYRWSTWKFHDPTDKLQSSTYTKYLTKLLCVNHSNINITIV